MNTPDIIKKVPGIRFNYSDEDIAFVQNGIEEILRSGYFTMGEKVAEFERQFAEFVDVEYAIAVNNGTSALEVCLRALRVEGKSVIIPTNTFMATPLAAIHAGAKIIFVDVMPDNLSIDPEDLKRKIRKDTIGVIPVHIGGIISTYWDDIIKICNNNNLFVLEDAAHAHGASFNGKMAGSLGIAGSFSFYPTKIINTAEGGMITTNEKFIYKLALQLREHGKEDPRYYVHTELGSNWRFSELHALLGLQQMKKVSWILAARQHHAELYNRYLKDIKGINILSIPENLVCSYYKYIVYLDKIYDRDKIKSILKNKFGVSLPSEVYPNLCHTQPVFKKYPDLILNDPNDEFPGAEYISNHQICLPIYPDLKDEELKYVVDCLKKVI